MTKRLPPHLLKRGNPFRRVHRTHFRCGHPKSPENTWSAGIGHRRCKFCRQAWRKGGDRPRTSRGDGVTTFRSCGHPKAPGNTWSGGRYLKCKTCHAARVRRWREHGPMNRRPTERKSPAPDLSHDPAVQLYRAEKARRSA